MCNGSAYLRLGAAAKFINQDERLFTTVSEEGFHILQMGAIGAQVVFYGLLVADIHHHTFEDAHVRIIVNGGEHAALHHILHHTHSFQAHRLATGIRTGNQEQAVFVIERDIEGHHFFAVLAE